MPSRTSAVNEEVAQDEEKSPQQQVQGSGTSIDSINEKTPHGIQTAYAMTQVWSKQHLVIAYFLIWIVHFMLAFSSGIVSTLTPYVTSSFALHSLTATTSIIAGLISGLIKLPVAKLTNLWGRPQTFALMVGSITLGLVMMAGCNNVETYCAAQVFYQIGYSTIDFTLSIFIIDTSKLKNRAFWFAFVSSPWIATIWAYGPATESILNTIGYRWGFGIWAIIFPVICAPLFGLFYYNQKKAERMGLVTSDDTKRTAVETVVHYIKEFDVAGLLLISTGLALFLLSFSLYSYQPEQWISPMIICFIIVGGLLIIAFALYERFLAPVKFMPWELMKDRTVFFTYTMVASLYCAWYIWDSYFYSLLIVLFDQSVTDATYISNIYTVGSCFWSIIVGIIVRYNGRLKWQALFFGVPITALAVGLMIKFRQPDVNIGYIVMCQIFIAFGGGTLVICEQMTVMAVSVHEHIPAVLAMESMISSVGGSIGSTIAAALWTGIFPDKLAEYLPADAQSDLESIYGSLVVQSSYPVGSPERDAIDKAYGDTQRIMLITATALYSITLFSVMMWRDVNVKNVKSHAGVLF